MRTSICTPPAGGAATRTPTLGAAFAALAVAAGATARTQEPGTKALLTEPATATLDARRYGFELEADLTSELTRTSSPASGSRGSGRGLLSVRLSADLERTLRLPGLHAFADYRSTRGRPTDTGDLQGLSGIEAEDSDQLAELWLEQRVAGDSTTVRWGVLDANREFAAVDAAGNFATASIGTSPTLLGMPSWPATAPGIELHIETAAGLSIGAGFYDTRHAAPLSAASHGAALPADWFAVLQTGLVWRSGRLAVGGWRSEARSPRFAGSTRAGAGGVYVLGEQQLWREHRGWPESAEGLRAFGLVAATDGAIAPAARHAMAGLTYVGALPGRPADEIGLALSHVVPGTPAEAAPLRDERVAELYYRVALGERTALQVGVQHIAHAGGGAADAWALGVRCELAF